MNKSISTLLAISLILIFAVFGIASSSSDDATNNAEQSKEAVETQNQEQNGKLGDYVVEIKSARFSKTYDGKDAVIVTYGFTNNSSNPSSFSFAIEDAAFQNGIGLNETYFLEDGDSYSSDNQTKEIKTGSTLDVDVAYELNDSTSDIEIEVKELISFSDKKITKTFTIN